MSEVTPPASWLHRQVDLFNSTWSNEKVGSLVTAVPADECRRRLAGATAGLGPVRGSAGDAVRLYWRRDEFSNALKTVIYCRVFSRPNDTAVRYEIRTDRLGATYYAVVLSWVALWTIIAPVGALTQNDTFLAVTFVAFGLAILSGLFALAAWMRGLSNSDGDLLLGHVESMLEARAEAD